MNSAQYRQALIDQMSTPVTQHHVMAGSINTAYLSSGVGEAVILLHGAGAGAVTWYPSIRAIAEHFYVIAPDIVGYGESDKPKAPYDRTYFSKWLKAFLLGLNISKAHIVGLSQGGAIAIQFALDSPEMVDKLVLVDAGGLGAKPPFASFLGMLWLNSFPSALANQFYAQFILFNPKKRDINHALYSIAVLKQKGGKYAFQQGRGAAVAPILEDSLRQVTQETLMIWGENDRLFPMKYGKVAAKVIPNARFCGLKNAGHLSHIDQPEAFNHAVLRFLTENAIDQ